ncbi:hypothetical protein [Methylobacterium platani]|uniref:Uncharacterized protein n=2 Tax=Methylobacterium platani TaxID=427683 RepID=A0A179SEI6_9HYPH|nr:hypothetical protein [Methylobacterium platani]KMO10849.1 hypothetical protein SQ03_28950 [Methylobacterium platani JCM 14648]OAS25291.1 hypothetical protein A5481_10275 [Methylobacterium platani]
MHHDATRSHPERPRASLRGVLLTLAGVVIGSAGYYASWRFQTPIGTLGGIAGLALCVIGTSHGHDGAHTA